MNMHFITILILTVALHLSQQGYVEYTDELDYDDSENAKANATNQSASDKLKNNSPADTRTDIRSRSRSSSRSSSRFSSRSGSNADYSFPANCAEVAPRANGPYLIKVANSKLSQFFAYCELDPEGGRAWTRIQHNRDGTRILFARDWKTYKYGFGDVAGDYFIGLEKLHALTLTEPHELWIQLEDHQGNTHHFKYSLFAIAEEYQQYALNVLGTYTGYLRDSLRKHVGMKFGTYDKDPLNCAKRHSGGWWFQGCFPTFLNGDRRPNRTGIVWYKEFGKLTDYRASTMLIRPALRSVHSK